MTTPCTACTATALGTELTNVCTQCATATVAGVSISIPLVVAAAVTVGVVVVAARWMRTAAPPTIRRPALG
ncbi:MAG: hypothetical protein AAF297_11265 [Planctomycetota bacterium]